MLNLSNFPIYHYASEGGQNRYVWLAWLASSTNHDSFLLNVTRKALQFNITLNEILNHVCNLYIKKYMTAQPHNLKKKLNN